MFCPKCGGETEAGSRFCGHCGASMPQPSKADSFELEIDYSKNGNPDAPAPAPVPTPAPEKKPEKKNDGFSKVLAVLLIVLALIAIAMISYLILRISAAGRTDSARVSANSGTGTVISAVTPEPVPEPTPVTEASAAPTPAITPAPTPVPTPVPTPAPTPVPTPENKQYLLADSSSRYLTEADISSLSHAELCLARNEIFARHGRKFINPSIASYFASQPWYKGTIEANAFSDDMLTEIEKANVNLIQQYEIRMYGGSYY